MVMDKEELKSDELRKKFAEEFQKNVDEVAASTAEAAELVEVDISSPVPKKYYGIDDIAEAYQVTGQTVRRWCEQGRIRALSTPGGHWRIPVSQFPDLAKVKAFQGAADRINERFHGTPEIDDYE